MQQSKYNYHYYQALFETWRNKDLNDFELCLKHLKYQMDIYKIN